MLVDIDDIVIIGKHLTVEMQR